MQNLSITPFTNKLLSISTVSEKYHNAKIVYTYNDYFQIEYNSETGNKKTVYINRNYIVSIEILD